MINNKVTFEVAEVKETNNRYKDAEQQLVQRAKL